MSETKPDVSIVIVSWNVRELLHRCLTSVFTALRNGPSNYEVIVVDNGSHDGTVAMIAANFPVARLFANAANLGFTKANNQAICATSGRHVLLLNPDTEVSAHSICRMVNYLDTHQSVGVLGPKLLFPDGTIQPSRRRFPTMATGLVESTPLQRLIPRSSLLRRYYVTDRSPDDVQEVDWVTGACLMVRRAAFEQVGLLDEGFFMYSEELDWCRRLKRAKWQVMYLPSVQVVHHEAQSSEQNVLARHKHFHDSKVRYFRKHHGPIQASILRLDIVLCFLYMLVEETVKYIAVPTKRSLHRPRLGTLATALLYHARRLAG